MTGRERFSLSRGHRATAPAVLCALLALVASAAAASEPPPPFVITFWCGPPLAEFDDGRAAEIAAAGFTVVGPPCEGSITPAANLRALDVAARHGLRMWVKDPRFSPDATRRRGWGERLADAVTAYTGHPALAGYFVWDEPTWDDLPRVAAMLRALHERDPDHLAYINLLPDYAAAKNIGARYADYVEGFLRFARPRLLSYDYYPFGMTQTGTTKDRTTFFANLRLMRQAALRHDVPFLLIVQAMPHGSYRDPTAAELSWQVFHALAFGARGVSYFAYWTPVAVPHAAYWRFRKGLIENGQRTRKHFAVARLNRVLRVISRALAGARSTAVRHSTSTAAAFLPAGPLTSVDGGPVTVGLFAARGGGFLTLLVNRDYRATTHARLHWQAAASSPQILAPRSARWQPLPSATVELAPGSARLLRWR